ncbi:MAG: Ig-like domain-containing protein [Bacteroidales bacterium]|nr:Ig-like domain-containing protein [Bacteroidales bacterium]
MPGSLGKTTESVCPEKKNKTKIIYSKRNNTKRIICCHNLAILFIILLYGCAQVGAPTGGPRDTTPPLVVKSEPGNRTINFSGNEITILFDEYIVLKNLNRELLVSPPLEIRPDVRVRSKYILISLNNDLLPNTTYTMNFGDAITDNNEGNILKRFEFVFSTGSYIDSLALTGTALSATDHKPPLESEDVYIMLYEDPGDSVPLLELPRYLGGINESGHFLVNNIRPGTFRVIALKDTDGDLRYDPLTDAIAFADTLVVIGPETVEEIHIISDTVQTADTVRDEGFLLQAVKLDMYYFYEETGRIFLNTRSRESPREVFLTFTRSAYDSVTIRPLNFEPDSTWFIAQYTSDMDSIRYWITDTSIAAMERIDLEVSFMTTDPEEQFIMQHDTVQLLYRPTERARSAARRQEDALEPQRETGLRLTSGTANNRSIEPKAMIRYIAGTPLAELDPGRVELKRIVDSLEYDHAFTVVRDTNDIRCFMISALWEEESQYHLVILPGAVSDIFGLENDSVRLNFSTLPEDYYANIRVTVESAYFPLIIQLMDAKEQIVRQHFMERPGTFTFEYMIPGTYSLKAIHDRNNNKKWDTGNYFRKIQPESVFYNKTRTEARSNWDYEILWQITD